MLRKDIEENFPFLSVITYGGQEYIGIINNQDNSVTTMYVYTDLKSQEEKQLFIELGETWWWESNRMIPIGIFLRDEMQIFRYCLQAMNTKDVKITLGPTVDLSNLSVKRVKRKTIQLVRKPKN
jgi:hypothetical protein